VAASQTSRLILWPTTMIAFFVGIPVVVGLAGTLFPALGYLPALGHTDLSFKPFQDALAAPGMSTSILLSFGIGLAATALSLLLVLFFTASWYGTSLFQTVSRVLSPLLAVPHAAAAFGLAFLVAPSGFLMRLISPWATGYDRPPDLLILNDPLGLAMVLGLVAKEVPFLLLVVLAAMPQTKAREMTRVAANLGYGSIRGFFAVIIPQLYPQIRLPVFAVLAYSTSVVDVAIILGPTTPAPLAPRILEWFFEPAPAMWLQASAAALLQVVVTASAMLFWVCAETVMRLVYRWQVTTGDRAVQDFSLRWLTLGFIGTILVALLFGFTVLAIWSVARGWWFPDTLPNTFTLFHWRMAIEDNAMAIWTTAAVGLGASLPCLALVLWLLEVQTRRQSSTGKAVKGLLFVPLLVPQISFLFGLHVLFVWLGIGGTYLAVTLAHLVFVLPYVFLAFSDPWHHLDPRYGQVATSLGVSNWRIFWSVRLPLLLTPLLIALAIGFAVSVGQYLPTALIGAGRITTVTTESLAVASGSNRSLVAVYAILQLVLPFIAFTLATTLPALIFRKRSGLTAAYRV